MKSLKGQSVQSDIILCTSTPSEYISSLAEKYDIPVYQPEDMNDPALFDELSALKPDLSIVVAYGKLIPDSIIAIPKYNKMVVYS